MKNIAVVIGVSDYDSLGELLGCKQDADIMCKLLLGTQKYDKILSISSKTKSYEVKDKLVDFLDKYRSETINELLFYFTGHGDFLNDEFYYLLSDYNNNQRKSSSLQNSEVDNLIRSLNPNITIKIVDACHSGVSYIKDANIFEKYLQKNTLNNCYFFFSSTTEQSSYQNKDMSFFTKSFVSAILSRNGIEIRYKDIMDYISDEFADNSNQTPFFVVQANYTEKFGLIPENIRKEISSTLQGLNPVKSGKTPLVLKAKQLAEKFCNQEDIIQLYNVIRETVSNYTFKSEIADLYTLTTEVFGDINNLPQIDTIGNWLEKKGVEDYFVRLIIDDDNPFSSTKIDIELEDLPFKAIRIYAKANYQSIQSYTLFLFPIFSRTRLRLFSYTTNYLTKGWNDEYLNAQASWKYKDFDLKPFSEVQNTIVEMLNLFDKYIATTLAAKFNEKEDAETQTSHDDDSADNAS